MGYFVDFWMEDPALSMSRPMPSTVLQADRDREAKARSAAAMRVMERSTEDDSGQDRQRCRKSQAVAEAICRMRMPREVSRCGGLQ